MGLFWDFVMRTTCYLIIRSFNSEIFQKNMAGPSKSSTIARLVGIN